MCIDAKTSLNSFIMSFAISIILIMRNNQDDIWIASFIIAFSFIQFLEYSIWSHIDDEQKNHYYTRLIPLVLLSHPIVQTMGALLSNQNNQLLSFVVLFYIILFIICFVNLDNYTYKSSKGEKGHLVWYRTSKKTNQKELLIKPLTNFGIFYIIGLIFGLFFMKSSKKYYLITHGVFSYFYLSRFYQYGEFSSMWCFIAILYSFIALIF